MKVFLLCFFYYYYMVTAVQLGLPLCLCFLLIMFSIEVRITSVVQSYFLFFLSLFFSKNEHISHLFEEVLSWCSHGHSVPKFSQYTTKVLLSEWMLRLNQITHILSWYRGWKGREFQEKNIQFCQPLSLFKVLKPKLK